MSATIGTDADTGMTTIKFDSTGRTVQFTKGESDDFRLRMEIIKTQGKLSKESIGSQSIFVLQELGEALEEENMDLVRSIWKQLGEKVVEKGILNNMIEKIEYENPFSLYFINNELASKEYLREALKVSEKVKEIIDSLAHGLIVLEIPANYKNKKLVQQEQLVQAADGIKAYYDLKTGLSDTSSREAVIDYLGGLLEPTFDNATTRQLMQDLFYNL